MRALMRAAQDRVVAVGDAGHLDGRARRRQVGDVAGELGERSLHLVGRGIGIDEALDHDLGARRHFQIDRLASHQLAPARRG